MRRYVSAGHIGCKFTFQPNPPLMSGNATDYFFNNMGRFQLLEHDQICKLAALVQAWQTSPNPSYLVKLRGKAARDKIVRHNLRLIVHIWRNNYESRLPIRHPGLLDAFQNCAIDLTRAAEKYQPSKAKFSTYAAPWIHKGFKYFLANERLVRIPTNNVHLIKAAQAMIARARMEGRDLPTTEEMVAELGATRKNVPSAQTLEGWLYAASITDAVSFSTSTNDDVDGDTLGDRIQAQVDERGDDHDRDEVLEAMKFLSEREQQFIRKRYMSGRHLSRIEDCASSMGVSRSTGHNIEKSAIESIRNLIGVN